MLGAIDIALECGAREVTPVGWYLGLTHTRDEFFVVASVLNELSNT